MKTITSRLFNILCFVIITQFSFAQVIDMESTSEGILIPRMTTTQRLTIVSPSQSETVYDINTKSFWYWENAQWNELGSGNQLSDADGNTKIQVEEISNEDVVRFDIGGTEFLKMSKSASSNLLIEPVNTNNNIFLGIDAGVLSSGSSNVALGPYAGQKLTTGISNTLIGRGAGQDITTNSRNTFMGRWAGRNNLGQDNIYAGAYAGQLDSLGSGNAYFGAYSGQSSTGFNNVFYGIASGQNNSGNGNTYFGSSSGSNSAGDLNVCVGLFAGNSNQGSNNVMIGSYSGLNNVGDNKLYIDNSSSSDPLIYGEFDNNLLQVNGDHLVKAGSAFFGDDTGGLPTSYGKGVRVYVEQPSNKGRVFAYDYSAAAPLDLVLQAPGGNVSIGGDFADGFRLSVDGKVACEEVLVDLNGDWPDYVFEDEYDLNSLEEVQKHISEKGHLPGVPSAQEVESNGIQIGEMNMILMEKIEELTLYILDQDKKIKAQEQRLKTIEENKKY